MIRLDPGPLLEVADGRARASRRDPHLDREEASAAEMGAVLGVCARTVHRWRLGARLTAWRADECAVRLNLHPVLVWGSDWPS